MTGAKKLADYAKQHFYDAGSGMFFFNAANGDPSVIRKIELTDNALPSSNASMADVLYDLGVYFDNDDYLKRSTSMVAKLQTKLATTQATQFLSWATVAELFALGSDEVAITGPQALSEVAKVRSQIV